MKIILVRHGRSAHVERGWLDLEGFVSWRATYESHGLMPGESAPHDLVAIASHAEVLSSDRTRAVESARLLTRAGVATSPLLREIDIMPPGIRGVRLPLIGWALLYGVRLLTDRLASRPSHSAEDAARAEAAARWIVGQGSGRDLVVVTHAGFRSVLAKQYVSEGWKLEKRNGSRNWSAWTLTREHPLSSTP